MEISASDCISMKLDPGSYVKIAVCDTGQGIPKSMEISASDCISMKLDPGSYVKIAVCDTGQGIPKSIIERVFEPYFTTKAPGEGTGLGLSVVHGIVRSYKGDIKIYSEPGKGTTVSIYLPCITMDKPSPRPYEGDAIVKGHERILLIDDEEYIITMMKEMLERLGYRITSFTDSRKAYEAFRSDPHGYDLVITDQTMPHLTGSELSEEFLRIRPGIPVIVCTGFSEILSEEKAKAIGICEYVTKPVVKSEIAKAIRNALNSRGKEN
jgi:CheY-like chemotaxis protein